MGDCTDQVDLESTPAKMNTPAVAGIAAITAAVLGTATAAVADGYVNGHHEANGTHGVLDGANWTSSPSGITVYFGNGSYGTGNCVSARNGVFNFNAYC